MTPTRWRTSAVLLFTFTVALLLATTALAQPPFPPGGPPGRPKDPNDIVRRGGNAEVILNDDGSITLTSLGAGGDSPTTTTVTADDIEDLPERLRRNRRVARTDDRYVTLYKLTTGEFQVNIGPDDEGKVFVYIFTVDPRQCIRSYQFTSEDKSEQFSGSCG